MAATSELTDSYLIINGTTSVNGIETTLSSNASKLATSQAIYSALGAKQNEVNLSVVDGKVCVTYTT